MHLAVYSDARVRGGAEEVLGLLLATLDPEIDVTVIGTDDRIVDWLTACRPEADSVVIGHVRGKKDLSRMWAHRRLLRKLRPDVFQANLNMMNACQYAVAIALSVGSMPVIAVEHSPMAGESRLSLVLKRWTSRHLAAHVSVGDSAARQVEQVGGLPAGSVRVIVNAVADEVPVPIDLGVRSPVIGSIGRLEPLKGYDMLLLAAACLDAHIVLIGDGPAQPDLLRLADDLAMRDRVHMLGWQERPRDLLTGIDVFVLPSRLEGMPLVVLHAMLAGLPVVATDVGSVAEVVDDGLTGLLVPVDDVEALRAALVRLLTDVPLAKRMGAAGRARVLERFTPERMARAWEETYDEVLQ